MNKQYLLISIGLLALLIISFVSEHYRMKNYYDYLTKSHELCLESSRGQENSIELCSQITSVANITYSTASSSAQESLYMAFTGFVIIAGWIAQIERRQRQMLKKDDV